MHSHPHNLLWVLYLSSNGAIAAGYAVMPVLVLPYLPLTRAVRIFGAGFFALCGLTHAGMAFGSYHVPINWFWTAEHALQAVATWGFIITFHVLLRHAAERRDAAAQVVFGRSPAGRDDASR